MLQQVEQDVRQQVLSPPAAKAGHPTPLQHVPLQASPAAGASTPERR
jgi:hypothetical protein